jgi:PHD/YefM family antitoxin component YafN of YafNO toxin-antitoxin module
MEYKLYDLKTTLYEEQNPDNLQDDWEQKQEQKFFQEQIAENIDRVSKLLEGRRHSVPASFVVVGQQIYELLLMMQKEENEQLSPSRKTNKRTKRVKLNTRKNKGSV